MKERQIVVIGDLNAAHDVLIDILRGTGLVDRKLRWTGGVSELVQMGDIFNRGGGALNALRLLLRLQLEAKRAGGRVTVLLGNHEAMTALHHHGYCTEEEYLAFASAAERRKWPGQVDRALRRLIRKRTHGVIPPIEPRLEAWKIAHVPGRAALRRELGPRGKTGRALRRLPVLHVSGETLFVHAGLLPKWAELGIDALNEQASREWREGRRGLWTLPKTSLFRSSDGPLWDRSLVRGGAEAHRALTRSLRLLGVRRMVVGHSQTRTLPGGEAGRVLLLSSGKLVAVDVGLRSGDDTPRTALILQGSRGYEWTPERRRLLWKR